MKWYVVTSRYGAEAMLNLDNVAAMGYDRGEAVIWFEDINGKQWDDYFLPSEGERRVALDKYWAKLTAMMSTKWGDDET